MKKRMIKVMSLVLVIALVFGFMLNARAFDFTLGATHENETYGKLVGNTSTITVNNVVSGDQLSAFKVLDAYYNESSNVITYEFTTDFKAFLASTAGTENDYSSLTVDQYYDLNDNAAEFEKLAIKFATYVKANSVAGTPMTMNISTATLTTTAGSYLILPTAAVNVYSVMVANLDFKANGSDWELNTATVEAKATLPTLTASVDNDGYPSTSTGKGEVFNYLLKSEIPSYPTSALNTSYYMTAELPSTIDLNGISNITIKDGDVVLTTNADGSVTNSSGDTVATIVFNNDTKVLTINFDLTKVTAAEVNAVIPAILNDSAYSDDKLGQAQISKFKLNYSNDPYSNTNTIKEIEAAIEAGADDIVVYSYGLKITLTDGTTPLAGAEFNICEDATCATVIKNGGTPVVLTTDADGIAKFAGLKDGTYYIKQTKATAGYRLMTTNALVKVGPVSYGSATDDGYYSISLTNDKAGLLPSTGGIGTLVFTVIGILVVSLAFYFVIVYRRKNQPEQ